MIKWVETHMRFAKEEVELVEFSDAMLDRLEESYAPLKANQYLYNKQIN